MDFRLYCKHCGKLTGGGGKQLGISHINDIKLFPF